jgi:hypothetical protein
MSKEQESDTEEETVSRWIRGIPIPLKDIFASIVQTRANPSGDKHA